MGHSQGREPSLQLRNGSGRANGRTMTTPVILEVALNGATSKAQNPMVPRASGEIAGDAIACLEAGAAIVHTHTDGPTLPPREGASLYLEAYRPVLAARPDAILYPTIAIGGSIGERYDHTVHLAEAGAIRCAPFDTGSVNLGGSAPDGWPVAMDFVYANSPNDIRYMAEVCRVQRLGPSVAVFEPGFLRVVASAWRAGALPPGTLVKLYFAERGYLFGDDSSFGAPPIPEALEMYLAMLRGIDLPWAIAVIGGSVLDSPLAPLALARGGHLRVGLEDRVDATSNVDEVQRAARLVAAAGRRLATCGEAVEMLGLPAR